MAGSDTMVRHTTGWQHGGGGCGEVEAWDGGGCGEVEAGDGGCREVEAWDGGCREVEAWEGGCREVEARGTSTDEFHCMGSRRSSSTVWSTTSALASSLLNTCLSLVARLGSAALATSSTTCLTTSLANFALFLSGLSGVSSLSTSSSSRPMASPRRPSLARASRRRLVLRARRLSATPCPQWRISWAAATSPAPRASQASTKLALGEVGEEEKVEKGGEEEVEEEEVEEEVEEEEPPTVGILRFLLCTLRRPERVERTLVAAEYLLCR